MSNPVGWIYGLLFGTWALGSILILVPRFRGIRGWDLFSILPEWKFFAPNPARGDFALLYRDQQVDGFVGSFIEVRLLRSRRWWSCVWNPHRRVAKAFFDATVELNRHQQSAPEVIIGSVPYITLLQQVSQLPRLVPAVKTQFLLLSMPTSGGEPRAVFLSEWHEL